LKDREGDRNLSYLNGGNQRDGLVTGVHRFITYHETAAGAAKQSEETMHFLEDHRDAVVPLLAFLMLIIGMLALAGR
jgi:hypothetical protein